MDTWIDFIEGLDITTWVRLGFGTLITAILYLLLTQPRLRRAPFQDLPAWSGIPAIVGAVLPMLVIMLVLGLVRLNQFYALDVSTTTLRCMYPLGSVTLKRSEINRASLTLAGRRKIDLVIRSGEQRYRSIAFHRSRQDLIGKLTEVFAVNGTSSLPG